MSIRWMLFTAWVVGWLSLWAILVIPLLAYVLDWRSQL